MHVINPSMPRLHRKDIVTSALDSFLTMHLPQSSIGAIDDIVLNYVVGVLEDVGNDDEFDVGDFVEMMEAYIPGFKDITSATVCEWIFQLSEEVLSATYSLGTPPSSPPSVKENTTTKESVALPACPEDIELPYSPSESVNRRQENISSCSSVKKGKKTEFRKTVSNGPSSRNMDDKIKLLAEMFPDSCKVDVKRCLSDSNGDVEQAVQAMLQGDGYSQTCGGSLKATDKIAQGVPEASSSSLSVTDDNIQLLLEMFPGSSELQARQCLSIARGDLEQASQVLLNLQESGKLEDQSSSISLRIEKSSVRNETHVKESLLEKYGYIDTDEDRKNHRPMEPKKEKKKMVRYINSQKVTTKGRGSSRPRNQNQKR
ncbi:CUE domain-containing protein 2-A-like isoform X2 [Patiria miniata]|uniref:CUE domain-containing protein n=1 Tax=Patiria miniata TaxID=46514 RepID=A0A913ZBP0_PATMI|nr:CUE domain-containing protein 2-A-like isoform X2 [Patiria miniata]